MLILPLAVQAGLYILFTVQPELTRSSWARPCSFFPLPEPGLDAHVMPGVLAVPHNPPWAPWLYCKGTRSKQTFFSYYRGRNRREVQHDQTIKDPYLSFPFVLIFLRWSCYKLSWTSHALAQSPSSTGPRTSAAWIQDFCPTTRTSPPFLPPFVPSVLSAFSSGSSCWGRSHPHPQTPVCGPGGQKWMVMNCSRPVFGITLLPAGC